MIHPRVPMLMNQSTPAPTKNKMAARNRPCRSCPRPGIKRLASAEITFPAEPWPADITPINAVTHPLSTLQNAGQLPRMRCRTDVVDLQQQWAQQATQEYLTEGGRVTDLASRLVKESWEPVYDRANQVLSKTGPFGE